MTTTLKEAQEVPETFIHQLRRFCYYTVRVGKISHHPEGYGYPDEESSQLNLPYSWDEMLLDNESWESGHHVYFGYTNGTIRNSLDKKS